MRRSASFSAIRTPPGGRGTPRFRPNIPITPCSGFWRNDLAREHSHRRLASDMTPRALTSPMRFIAMIWLLVAFTGNASAQSSLPVCPTGLAEYWHNCFGMLTYLNGSRYFGQWRDGKYHGHGRYEFLGGWSYVGEWLDGKYHGQGTFTPDHPSRDSVQRIVFNQFGHPVRALAVRDDEFQPIVWIGLCPYLLQTSSRHGYNGSPKVHAPTIDRILTSTF